ncbi:MAG: cyclodeaminase/cyclohydrolase family protein [Candidatus Thalassarchaeaceae archaeon]|jgi:formiminotetrahydrofolate cyclodeaminase|nr:cyclodeaminase/cyclohydrolase family protein [Candidatus Thalassarchaeaceae archaeon]
MTKFGDMSLNEFASALASDNPTPGGGSASAVALSQAGSLACMVANLTIGRDRYKSGWESAEKSLEIGRKAMEMGHDLADADAAGYDAVMDAYRLPKDTDDERTIRKDAIINASIKASMPPMEIAKLALELLHTLPELASEGNSNAITDVGVSSLLATAACKGGLFNSEINLLGMENEVAEEMMNSVNRMRDECRIVAKEVMHLVHESLSR